MIEPNLLDQTQLIAARLKGARLTADKTAAWMAAEAGVDEEKYLLAESGGEDFTFTFLYRCANALGLDISVLVSGNDPKLSFFNITRRDEGMPIKRRSEFDYRHLAPNMKNRMGEPFVVTAWYSDAAQNQPIPRTAHDGQELDMVLKGKLKIQIDEHITVLKEGDSIFYDSHHSHGMIAVGGEDCQFLAVVFKSEKTDGAAIKDGAASNAVESGVEKYRDSIYKKFVRETLDENLSLSKIEFTPPENYNFAYDVVDALASKSPNKTALVWASSDKKEKFFTFSQISKLSNQAANYFVSKGIKKGDRVMLVLKRHYQFWLSIIALHKIGAVVIPATSLLKTHDYEYRFKAAKINAIVCTAMDGCTAYVDSALDINPSFDIKIVANGTAEGWDSFDEGIKSQSDQFARVETGKDDISVMYFTSGTTGYPKIAQHTATYSLGHIVTARWWHMVEPDGLHFTIADTGWGKALWGKLYGQWLCEGAIMVYDFDRFVAEDILKLFERYKITTFCAPPTMYRFFIKEDLSKFDLSSLKHATIAGEALNPEVFNQFRQSTGLSLMEGFGQTETTLAIANLAGMKPKPGSMGKPNPQYDVDIIDDKGNSVAVGETGEIVIRATENNPPCGLFKGYYLDTEKTHEAWRDGIYYTGDTAWRDEDGYFWYVGRTDDLIKTSGYRVGPFEIESVIMELPFVLECAVTGVPDETRGQIIKATVVLVKDKAPSEELKAELQDYVKKNTAPYKYPRKVEFVEALPKTISGKIRRVELKN